MDSERRDSKLASSLVRSLYSHDEFRATHRFPALDGIRAIAALLVVAFHFAGPRGQFLGGWLGVHLFFVLSGFLITTLLLREERARGRISLADFWIRRAFRILPAYYVVLIATVGIIVLYHEAKAAGVPQSLGWFATLNPDLAPTGMGFTPAWTIGIEQKFYLVWPVLAFVIVIGRQVRRGLIWAAAVVLIAALTVFVSSYFVHFGVILLGAGLALGWDSPIVFRRLRFLTTPLAGLISALSLVALLLASASLTEVFRSQVPVIALFGLAATALLPALLGRHAVAAVLGGGVFRWLGDRSYSIYLIQVIGGEVVAAFLPGLAGLRAFPVIVLAIIVLADALHRWIEVPGIALGRRWVRARAARRDPALVPPPPGTV